MLDYRRSFSGAAGAVVGYLLACAVVGMPPMWLGALVAGALPLVFEGARVALHRP